MGTQGTGEAQFRFSFQGVQVRPATPRDGDFVFNVTEQAMRPYVEQLFERWDDAAQRSSSDACCVDSGCRIVNAGTVAAGLLFVREEPSELFLSRIYLMPDFLKSGVGTYLLQQLRDRADSEQKPLRLRVLVNNPARRLYERVGFRLTHSTEHHHHFEYVPGLGLNETA